ncbi:Protein kinase-like domain superfamily [Sesbania bispinosa]|nr:Protein kinase-like domain superfamily [Sesbania bispinosa]
MDDRIQRQYPLDRAQKVATLAFQCLAVDPKFRPNMDEVVRTLERLQESKDKLKNGDQREHRVRGSGVGHSNGIGEGSAVSPKRTAYPRPSPLYA